jgi:archaellum component FlaC
MAKNWNEMSYAEKCEDLRKDIKRLFEAVNSITGEVTFLRGNQNEMRSTLSEVAKAVEKLEREIRAKGATKKG